MAFEKSPNFDGEDFQQNSNFLNKWVSRHPRLLLMLLGFLIALNILIVILYFLPTQNSSLGGLDGCIVNSNGEAVSAYLQIDGCSLSTYEDGCFFFPSLEPGKHQLVIQIDSGQVIEQSVEILSGQAVGLGEISIVP